MKDNKENLKEIVKMKKISLTCSIVAIVICAVFIVYEFISKENEYTLWIVLLLSNLSILLSNIGNKE